jgi:uncharacterized protein YjbI with pentapeptide repeats
MAKTNFINCSLQESSFVNTNLTNATFDNCNLQKAIFLNTNLNGADFSNSFNFTIDPENNIIKKAKFSTNNFQGLLYKYDIKIV